MNIGEFIEKTKDYPDEYLWMFNCPDGWYKVSVGYVIPEDDKITLLEDVNKKITEDSLKISDIVRKLEGVNRNTKIQLKFNTPNKRVESGSRLYKVWDGGVAICPYKLNQVFYTKELV